MTHPREPSSQRAHTVWGSGLSSANASAASTWQCSTAWKTVRPPNSIWVQTQVTQDFVCTVTFQQLEFFNTSPNKSYFSLVSKPLEVLHFFCVRERIFVLEEGVERRRLEKISF